MKTERKDSVVRGMKETQPSEGILLAIHVTGEKKSVKHGVRKGKAGEVCRDQKAWRDWFSL